MVAAKGTRVACTIAIAAMLLALPALGCAPPGLSQGRAVEASGAGQPWPSRESGDGLDSYRAKVKEVVEAFGRPDLRTARDGEIAYASGLAYADLVDFGDGSHRLVLCYLDPGDCKDPGNPGSYPEDYKVEVWQESDGGVENAYSGTAQLSGQNIYCGAVLYNDLDGKRYIVTRDGRSGGPEGNVRHRAYGLDESGRFGLVTELVDEYSRQGHAYTLNGEPVSEKEGEEVAERWFDHGIRIGLSSVTNEGQPPLFPHQGH